MSVEIVPWICREEWEICRDNLFGEDLVMKKKAVEHLHIWKTRCLNLPVAVECTLILMDTHLQGMQLSENETRMLNLMNLELMYSMAVTKFVNFVTDCGTRSSNTLQDFAKELGIPAWIVDLRHKAAHCSSASSLPLLREAVEFCLKWLYDEYWTNADFEDVCNVDENSLIDVENYFDIYLIIKKHVSNDIQFVSQITEEDRQKIYRNFCKTSQVEDFERLDNWSLNETCTIILKKLSKIFKKNPRKGEQLVDKLLEDDSLISPSTLSDTNELNDNAVNTWTDIISVLCASKVSHYLLSSLIKITNDEMELTYRKKGAAIYLNEIFKNILQWKDNSAEDNNEESKKSKKKKKKRYDIEEKVSNTCLDLRRPQISHEEVSALLKLTLERPSVFVTIYLKSLLMIQEHSIPPTEIDKLLELVAIYNGHTGIKQLISDTRDHSLRSILGEDYESQSMELVCEDTPQSIITSIDQVENQDEADSNINDSNTVWKKCSNDWKWSQTPFGVLPWQEEFKPWLQLYQV